MPRAGGNPATRSRPTIAGGYQDAIRVRTMKAGGRLSDVSSARRRDVGYIDPIGVCVALPATREFSPFGAATHSDRIRMISPWR